MSLYDYKSIDEIQREQKMKAVSLDPPARSGIIDTILDPKFYPIIAGAGIFLGIGIYISKRKRRKKK